MCNDRLESKQYIDQSVEISSPLMWKQDEDAIVKLDFPKLLRPLQVELETCLINISALPVRMPINVLRLLDWKIICAFPSHIATRAAQEGSDTDHSGSGMVVERNICRMFTFR